MKRIQVIRVVRAPLRVSKDVWPIFRRWSLLNREVYNWAADIVGGIERLHGDKLEKKHIPPTWPLQERMALHKKCTRHLYGAPTSSLQKVTASVVSASKTAIDRREREKLLPEKERSKVNLPQVKPAHVNMGISIPSSQSGFDMKCEEGRWYLELCDDRNKFRVRAMVPPGFDKTNLKSICITRPRRRGHVKKGNTDPSRGPLKKGNTGAKRYRTWLCSFSFRSYEWVDPDQLPLRTVGVDVGARKDSPNWAVVATRKEEIARYGIPSRILPLEEQVEQLQAKRSKKLQKNGENWGTKRVRELTRRIRKKQAKIAAIRRQETHVVSKAIASLGRNIVLENLNVKKMTRSVVRGGKKPNETAARTTGRNRSMARAGVATLVKQIEYKAHWAGATVYEYNPADSSQICCLCGKKGKREKSGVFQCLNKKCRSRMDGDENAARNHVINGVKRGKICKPVEWVYSGRKKKIVRVPVNKETLARFYASTGSSGVVRSPVSKDMVLAAREPACSPAVQLAAQPSGMSSGIVKGRVQCVLGNQVDGCAVVRGSPVRAGMDPALPALTVFAARFPRTRGDGPRPRSMLTGSPMVPPYARGWTLDRGNRETGDGGSPVRAGMNPNDNRLP